MNKNFLILFTLLMLVHTDAFSLKGNSSSIRPAVDAARIEAEKAAAEKAKKAAEEAEKEAAEKEAAEKAKKAAEAAEKAAAEKEAAEKAAAEKELDALKTENAKVTNDIERFKKGEALPESVKTQIESLKFGDFYSHHAIKAIVNHIATGAEDPAPGVFGKMYKALKIIPTKIKATDLNTVTKIIKTYETKKAQASAAITAMSDLRAKELALRSVLELVDNAKSLSSLTQRDKLLQTLQSIAALLLDESLPDSLQQMAQDFSNKTVENSKEMTGVLESVKKLGSEVQKHHEKAQQEISSVEEAMKKSEKLMKIINDLKDFEKELSKQLETKAQSLKQKSKKERLSSKSNFF